MTIISILNLKYWETDETKKAKLKSIYDENEREFQQKINVYKQNNWLKTEKNEMVQEENKQEKALIEQKDIFWIVKIRRFFRNLIHLGRKREK